MQRKPSGFTLIELLVTLVIIAILAAMLLPTLNTAREKARSANCVSNLRVIMVGIAMYADTEAAFMPPSLAVLANGVYMQETPYAFIEPKTGSSYVYHTSPSIWQSNVASVSVEDPGDIHLGGRNQLMNDGQVRRLRQ